MNEETTPLLGVRKICPINAWDIPKAWNYGDFALRMGRGMEFPVGQPATGKCLIATANSMYKGLPSFVERKHLGTPAPDCTCGIYAYSQKARLDYIEQMTRIAYYAYNSFYCLLVTGWGVVFRGEKYWRAQYAEPLAVVRIKGHEFYDDIVRRGADFNLIPMWDYEEAKEKAEVFGRWAHKVDEGPGTLYESNEEVA